jgi:Arc/MetJ family transcription regulator
MRTTIDLPEDLLDEARSLAGTRSKTSTIILALKDFIDRRKIDELRKLRGAVVVERDLTTLRRAAAR